MRTRLTLLFGVTIVCGALMARCDDGKSAAGADAESPDVSIGGDAAGLPDGGMIDGGAIDGGSVDGGTVRHYTYRAIAGVSMGSAAASFIGGRHPEYFDVIGMLGGPISNVYFLHVIKRHFGGGFCSMTQILQNLADINDPVGNPGIFCGPVEADRWYQGRPFEHVEDFNHWFYSGNGGEFDRDAHVDVFQDIVMAMGNVGSYNDGNPYLPAGVDADAFRNWMADPERCRPGKLLSIDQPPFNCNAEYNPDCEYPLVMFCDGEEPVGCYHGDPARCGKDNPDYKKDMGVYDPYYPEHTKPLVVMTAVDYNRNGWRDYGEPLVFNGCERFSDLGIDGCADLYEDGKGECCLDADFRAGSCVRPYDKTANPDPNGDNYDWQVNPTGTEGNLIRENGESFDDDGLDGVKADASKGVPPDYGEGNGAHDCSPNVIRFLEHDLALNFAKSAQTDPGGISRIDMYMDAGIRDILNIPSFALITVGGLRGLGLDCKVYDDFWGRPTSVLPDAAKDGEYMGRIVRADFSADSFGKNVLVLYGKPDATEKEIEDGDGMHMGTPAQAINRFVTFFAFAANRWPKTDRKPYDGSLAGLNRNAWHYSASLGAHRRYTISLPPGYDAPENKDKTYPAVYFMHGYGMAPGELGMAGTIFQAYMAGGEMPKFITVFPDGRCCLINRGTGARECACLDDPSDDFSYLCVDENGVERSVPKSGLPEAECNRGSFYVDMVSDKYGDAESAKRMKYEGAVMDLIEFIEGDYRTRSDGEVGR